MSTRSGITNWSKHSCFLISITCLFAHIEPFADVLLKYVEGVYSKVEHSTKSVWSKEMHDFEEEYFLRKCIAFYKLMCFYKPGTKALKEQVYFLYDFAFERRQNYIDKLGDVFTALACIEQIFQKISPGLLMVCFKLIYYFALFV
jgi:hypothetical protein